MVGEALKRPRGRPSLNKRLVPEPAAVKARRPRGAKKEHEKEESTKIKQNEPRKRRRSTSKYFSQTDYQNGIVGIPCATQNNNTVITKHMRKRYWNSFEEMKLIEYWRRFSKEITTFQHQIPAFRRINELMRQSGIHITPQECRRKILALKNKFYAEKDRTGSDDNSDWSLYPIMHATICSDDDEQNLYAEENTILNYIKNINSKSFESKLNIKQTHKKKANFEPKRGTAAWRMIRDGPKSIYNVPYLLEWEKESIEVNESTLKETSEVTVENTPMVSKRSYRRRVTRSSFNNLSNNNMRICLEAIIEENNTLNQNLESDRIRLQKSEIEFAQFAMVIKALLLNNIGSSLIKRDSALDVNVTQLSNDIINVTSTKEFANITEMASIKDETVSTDSNKKDQETVASDIEIMDVSSSSIRDSITSCDSDTNSESGSEEISSISNKNDENSQDIIIFPSDLKIDILTDPLKEYTRKNFNNSSSIWSVDNEKLEADGNSTLNVIQTFTEEHNKEQKTMESVENIGSDCETNQESPTFNSQHSNGSLHDNTIKLDEMNVSSDNDSDEDAAVPIERNKESIQPSTSAKSRQLNAFIDIKITSQNISKNSDMAELSSSTEKENTNSSSTSKMEEEMAEITYFNLPSDDDFDMIGNY